MENFIEKTTILSSQNVIEVEEILEIMKKPLKKDENLSLTSLKSARDKFERQFILNALTTHNWNIPQTAAYLDTERTNLYKKMKKLGIGKE